ncbi:MAG TPA: hypothetical protein ENI88_11695 [Desulfobulbus sp.]|nr:hypothetical protein [Desulfobulbus sp.]
MSWNKSIEKVSGQLEKAREFRYFALLATFVFFLDFSLVVFHKSHISALSYKSIASDYKLGQVLLFFTIFTFFMSFVVPLTQYLLRFISMLLPYKILSFFGDDQWEDIEPKDYFYLYQLERYAIKNSNAIAYEYYKSLVSEKDKEHQLEFLCLALTISVALDCYAYFVNKNALFSWFIPFFSDNHLLFPNSIIALFLWALVLFSLYLGVIRAGGFSLSVSDRIYFPNNDFKKS